MGFLFSSGLFAATIHVNSSTGDDASGNGSSGSPYKTFHKAYTEASSDDIIDLTGTFTWTDAAESGDAATTGYTIAKNLTIQGQGAGATYIQAASTENSADRSVFKISGTVYLTNVTMADNDCSSNLGDGFFLLSSTRKQIKNKS